MSSATKASHESELGVPIDMTSRDAQLQMPNQHSNKNARR